MKQILPPLDRQPDRRPWWNDNTTSPAAPEPAAPWTVERPAQWVGAGDAIVRPAVRATAIVISTTPPAWLPRFGHGWPRERFLTWVVVDSLGRVTAEGVTVEARGTRVTVAPRESLGRRIAAQGLLVAELAGKAAALDTDATGAAADGLTAGDARALAAQDLDEQNEALGRLFALRARIIQDAKGDAAA